MRRLERRQERSCSPPSPSLEEVPFRGADFPQGELWQVEGRFSQARRIHRAQAFPVWMELHLILGECQGLVRSFQGAIVDPDGYGPLGQPALAIELKVADMVISTGRP